jgi:hypothetical protein
MERCDSDLHRFIDTEYQRVLPALNKDALVARTILLKGVQRMMRSERLSFDLELDLFVSSVYFDVMYFS